jgi:hypothetical protein
MRKQFLIQLLIELSPPKQSHPPAQSHPYPSHRIIPQPHNLQPVTRNLKPET